MKIVYVRRSSGGVRGVAGPKRRKQRYKGARVPRHPIVIEFISGCN